MEFPSIPNWIRLVCLLLVLGSAEAIELPPEPLAALASGDFKSRENGQTEILAWARLQPEASMEELLRYSRDSKDPEVRERCMAVLRELVMDQYMSEGPGFLGIGFEYRAGVIPEVAKPSHAIRVKSVSPDTPAEKVGLQADDLIVSLNGKGWTDASAALDFAKQVASVKPGTKVKLMIFRDAGLIEKEVVLTRRPLYADRFAFGDLNGYDPEADERAARDAYFKEWLSERKSRQ